MYTDFNNKIGMMNESFTYSEFYSTLSENTVNLLTSTNDYARQCALNSLQNQSNDDNTEDYNNSLKDNLESIINAYERIIESEYNRLYTRTVNMQSMVDTVKKRIITSLLPKCNEYQLGDKFFKPKLDILSDAINNPSVDLFNEVLGSKISFDAEDLNVMQTNIIALIQNIQTQIGKNRNTMKSMTPSISNNENFDKIIEIKNLCKIYIDGFKRVNMVYDEYLTNIQFILNEFIKASTNSNPNEPSEKRTIYPDTIDKTIGMDKIYDISQVNECSLDIDTKIKYINAQLENITIKLGIESLNESSDKSDDKSKFVKFLEWLWKAIKAIGEYIKTNWKTFVTKCKFKIDVYGKWIEKHKEKIQSLMKNNNTFEDNVCDWNWDGKIMTLPHDSIRNIIEKIIPYISPDTSHIRNYEYAINQYAKTNNGDVDANIYNQIVGPIFGIKAKKNMSKQQKLNNIIESYKKGPFSKKITNSDLSKYISVLENSKTQMKELLDSDPMEVLSTISEKLANDTNKAKSKMNSGFYDEKGCQLVNKYYSGRKRVLDVARQACNDLFDINFKLIDERCIEAVGVLKNFIKSNTTEVLNNSIDLDADEYIQLAALFEDSSDICMQSNLTQCGIIDKNANIDDFVSDIPSDIKEKINGLRLYPITKMLNSALLMRSELDRTVWTYNSNDKTLVCQNTLNSVCSKIN